MATFFITNADYLDDYRYVRANRDPARRVRSDILRNAIENSAVRRMSAANFVEAAVIIDASRDPVVAYRDFGKAAAVLPS